MHELFYARTVLCTNCFMHELFYARTVLCTDCVCAQIVLHDLFDAPFVFDAGILFVHELCLCTFVYFFVSFCIFIVV